MESSHTYATNSHDWNQIFPLFDNFRFRSIEGKLTFGFHQYYHYSNPFSTEEENSKKSSHSKYQNRNFKQSQQQFHKKNRFLVPKQYDSIKYVDNLIGWDRFSLIFSSLNTTIFMTQLLAKVQELPTKRKTNPFALWGNVIPRNLIVKKKQREIKSTFFQ